ncbi:unnamed protein product [Paramecium sonneborni]|uniref:WD domain, G-beta repeat protein n=1 Tax=Paramecium sonneborni TaxID=65129 RepID=A0A8S1MIN2_9CILI|nr:unnamed protein product [Paramecium sonneborni]
MRKIFLDPKDINYQQQKLNERLLCAECLENTNIDGKAIGLNQIVSLIEENQVEKMEKVQNTISNQINLIESLNCIIDQMKQQLIQQLDQLISIMMGWVQNLQQQYSQYSFYDELDIMLLKENQTYCNKQLIQIWKTNLCWTSKVYPKLEQFNQFKEYNKCKELLSSLELGYQQFTQTEQEQQIKIYQQNQDINSANTLINIPPFQMIKSSLQSNLKPFTYQQIQQSPIKQNEVCYAIAVNNNCSIMVAGCNQYIKLFEFNQGILKQVQLLTEHAGNISTLNFMKRTNNFISGSCDSQIIIWVRNNNNQWISQQKLNGHTSYINCLILNNNEDTIISGSDDKSIKFWIKENQWLSSQTITDHNEDRDGLSINDDQNKIISCRQDKLILVIEQSIQKKQWIVIQKIELEYAGVRLCFIDNNTFTGYHWGEHYMNVYEMNNTNKQYTRTKKILFNGGLDCYYFPQKYIKQKCILVTKNSQNISLIRRNQNGEFIVEQSIPFKTHEIFACMTDDGQYLITWDSNSKEYQIRCYKGNMKQK